MGSDAAAEERRGRESDTKVRFREFSLRAFEPTRMTGDGEQKAYGLTALTSFSATDYTDLRVYLSPCAPIPAVERNLPRPRMPR